MIYNQDDEENFLTDNKIGERIPQQTEVKRRGGAYVENKEIDNTERKVKKVQDRDEENSELFNTVILVIAIIVVAISIFVVYKFNVYKANLRANKIVVGDNFDVENTNLEELEQSEIKYDDIIGTLTIPNILLEDAPIKESTELSTLSEAIGHFTSTSIYSGNVGLA